MKKQRLKHSFAFFMSKYIRERSYANGFSMAVEEELKTESGKKWEEIFRNTITKENAEVLDDGTGAGFFPVILSRLGHKVTAIDYSDEMTAQAAKRFKEAGAEVLVRQMDAQSRVD